MTSLADRIEALQGPAKSMLRKISHHFREGDFFCMNEGERMPRSLIEAGFIQKQHFAGLGMKLRADSRRRRSPKLHPRAGDYR